jgi:AcrR family transcriptional regulator
MRGHDLLATIRLLEAGQKTKLTYREIGEEFGLSTSQAFDSVERCFEVGLVQQDRQTVNVPKLIELIQHSLPYLFPLKLQGPCHGFPLAMQSFGGVGGPQNCNLVWRVAKDIDTAFLTDGLEVEPLTATVPKIAHQRPELGRLLSCIELLRLANHPFKKLAANAAEEEINRMAQRNESPSGAANLSSSEMNPAQLDAGMRYVARYGFRASSFEKLAEAMDVSVVTLQKNFGSEKQFFQNLIDRKAQLVAGCVGHILLREQISPNDLKEAIAKILQYLRSNEDFYRLMLWCYLESDQKIDSALDQRFSLFIKIIADRILASATGELSAREALLRAYVFSKAPLWYAILQWSDSSRIGNKEELSNLLEDLRQFIDSDIVGKFLQASPKNLHA